MDHQQRIDVLDRSETINDLYNIIQTASINRRYCSFAIDGMWGVGKTFILEELEEKLEAIQNEETVDNRYFVFHYNCWKYDYYEEPAIAIVSALKEKVDLETNEEIKGVVNDSWNVAKDIIHDISKEFVKNKVGVDYVQVIDDIKRRGNKRRKENQDFDALFAFNKTVQKVNEQIKKLAKEKTIVIIVDELDRCMPSYAIKVLERLHHMFDNIANTVVLISVDSSQLERSIREIYGENVDVERYLKKFVSFKYHIDIGEMQDSLVEKFEKYFSQFENYEEVKKTLAEFYMFSHLDIRSIERIISKCDLIHRLISSKPVSNAVLLFEVICTTVEYIILNSKSDKIDLNLSKNLYWIPDIETSAKTGLENCLGTGLWLYIKDMVSNAGDGVTYVGAPRRAKNSPEGQSVAYMDMLLSKNKKLSLSPTKAIEVEEEVRLCEKYIRLCKNIY